MQDDAGEAGIDLAVDTGFARIVLAPAALADGVRHILVLEPTGVRLHRGRRRQRAEAAAASKAARKKGSRK